jgi:hypothetical protein
MLAFYFTAIFHASLTAAHGSVSSAEGIDLQMALLLGHETMMAHE